MNKSNELIEQLAKMLEKANKQSSEFREENFGKCEWVDLDGNARCNSPWSEFQCQQVSGTFYPSERC